MELLPGTEWMKAFICLMVLALPLMEFGISLFRFPSRTVKSGGICKRLLHYSAALSEGHWLSSDSQRRNLLSPLIAARYHTRREEQNHEPGQEHGTRLGEEEHDAEHALGGAAEPIDGRIVELHSDPWRR